MLDWGREITTDLDAAERREWLCTNGIGGFATGTVAGSLTRRYHGLLVAALAPPLGRTLVVAKVEETVVYDGAVWSLGTNRWASGAVEPAGHRHVERFHLDGTTPVWTYACADARLEKRIWMEPGANTTYVRYGLERAGGPLRLTLRVLVSHRDPHAVTRGGWHMDVAPVSDGVRVVAFPGAAPVLLQACGPPAIHGEGTHVWFDAFALPRERERGLEWVEDHLHAATFTAIVPPGGTLALVASTETDPSLNVDAAWRRRRAWEDGRLAAWRRAQASAAAAPPWIAQLVLAADQFLACRPAPRAPDGMTVIAGYPWFVDWARDTMVSLPGLTLATGRPDVGAAVLRTWAGALDRGLLPNHFPEAGAGSQYHAADAALWFVEALRAHHAATADDGLLAQLYPAVEALLGWHVNGTRHGIGVDETDGLLRAGEPGLALTWMDARIGDQPVTPRLGKPVEINALWFNALVAMTGFARRLGRPPEAWEARAARAAAGFARFWDERRGWCRDVLDGPHGDEDVLRPNQLLAVSLPASPLDRERQRRIVDACARRLLTTYGLRTLAPSDGAYRPACDGDLAARDAAYHQGTVWPWLLGPFALAHHRVYGDRDAARALLAPLAHHLEDHGLGTIAEILDGDAPHRPRGAIAQAWSVAETLRAWHALAS